MQNDDGSGETKKKRNALSIGDLRALRALAQEPRLEKAAKELGKLDPSIKTTRGLQQRISKIEAAIWPDANIGLFDVHSVRRDTANNGDPARKRESKRVLSLHGRKILPYVIQMISVWERLIEESDYWREFPTNIVIGAQFSIWDALARRLAARFDSIYGDVSSLKVSVSKSDYLIEGLRNFLYDVILTYRSPNDFGIDSEFIGNEILVLMSSAKYDSPEDIPAGKYLYVEYGEVFDDFHRNLYRQMPNIKRYRMTFERAGPALRYIREMKGHAAYVPIRMARRHIDFDGSGELHFVGNSKARTRPVYVSTRAPELMHDNKESVIYAQQRALGVEIPLHSEKEAIAKRVSGIIKEIWDSDIKGDVMKEIKAMKDVGIEIVDS